MPSFPSIRVELCWGGVPGSPSLPGSVSCPCYQTAAVGNTLLNSQLLYSSPSQIPALFSPGLFLLKISRTGGSQKQPQKKKKNEILVDAEIGISVSWVVRGRNKTWMQMSFSHRPWETCSLLPSEIHIFIPAISVLFPQTALNHCQCSAPAGVCERSISQWGVGGWLCIWLYISRSFNISTALTPHVLASPSCPLERDCLADSPKTKCAKWTWQIPGWLHMARSNLHVPGIPQLPSPY